MIKRLKNLSPFARVILAIVLGALTGVFFGERTGGLELVGDAYIRLLQMTVIPYILVSLIGGLGALDARMARRIGARGGGVILLLWTVALATVLCLPLAYPRWTSAAFFSSSLIADRTPFDPLLLYVPSNLFYALGQGLVPAVVLFSIAMGLSLIAIKEKEELLKGLSALSAALMKMASFVGKLAPIGIFAVAAAAAGTLRVDELNRLQVFLWVYLSAWSLLVFFLLPALVAAGTPFTFREMMRSSRVAMVTAFAVGTVLVVLPLIAEQCKSLLEKRGLDAPEARRTVDVMIPTAYSFPSVGTLLGLGFVLFAAWYIGTPVSVDQYPKFSVVGALVSFGSMAVAIPYMLDLFSMPADLFQLYLLGSVVTARFATALAAMHGVAVCLLAATAVLGKLRIGVVVRTVAVGIGVTVLAMAGLGVALTRAIPYAYTGKEVLITRGLHGEPVEYVELERTTPLSESDRERPRLDVIRERGTLRFGYTPARTPWAYRSKTGDVIGYDIDLAHRLADDLQLTLELVCLDWEEAVAALEDGGLDVLGGGQVVTPSRALETTFTRSYLDQSVGFVVRDHRHREFGDLASMRSHDGLRIAIVHTRHYEAKMRALLPQAEFVSIDSVEAFFEEPPTDVDMLCISAQAASSWTLLYPQFTVVVPSDLRLNGATGLALPPSAPDLKVFLDTWLELNEKGGLMDALFEYWVLGRDERSRRPRWCVMTDVLGWGSTPTRSTE